MKQETRTFLAIFLIIAIIVVYYTFISPPQPFTPEAVVTSETTKTQAIQHSPQPTTTPQTTTLSPTPTVEATTLPEAPNKNITIKNQQANLVLSTQGGMLTSYTLNNYRKTSDKKSPPIDILGTRNPADSHGLFLGLKDYNNFHHKRVFEIQSDQETDASRVITLVWQDQNLKIEKIFTFQKNESPYAIKIDFKITNLTSQPLSISPYLENSVKQTVAEKRSGFLAFLQQPQEFYQGAYFSQQKLFTQTWETLEKTPVILTTEPLLSWSAIKNRYFLHGIIPQTAKQQGLKAEFMRTQDEALLLRLFENPTLLNAQSTYENSYTGFFGPKELSQLRATNSFLEEVVDYGWFSMIAKPILIVMEFIHKFVGNWGLTIIVLTIFIKILLHPINKKSFASMKGMQQLQPKLQEIRKKYPEDKQKQQVETMQLFRTHKINPLSGCILMFLQFPVYVALYQVLYNAIELYHAPFFGFYKDLSAPDPYFILPILLGVFMVLQQKLTPATTADPTQKKIMMIMPLMFSVFMLFLPLGLVLYIFVNTVVSVVQQFMIQRDLSIKEFFTGKWQKA